MKTSSSTLYQRIGGEPVLRAFVTHLYDAMDAMPEVAVVRKMHPKDLSHAREALYLFLSGMLGGPPLYMMKYGHPRLRQRHMRFRIGDSARDQWLLCAETAMAKLEIGEVERNEFTAALTQMANHLRNQGDATGQRQVC